MTDWPAIITAIGGVVTAIGVILVGYWSFQANKRTALIETKVDGTQTLLQEQTRVAVIGQATAEGITLGEQAERDRNT